MTATPHPENVSMRVGGVYFEAARGAMDVIGAAAPLVLESIRSMEMPRDCFTLCDMGCADGATSLAMIRAAIEAVRARAPSLPVCVVHADQPLNDYNALMRTVHGLTGVESFVSAFDEVYPLASASSFFRRILPPRSLHLGFSACAMHWLSTKPCNLTDHVHPAGAEGAELAAYRERARLDWETLLAKRASELVPGGRLVLAPFARDAEGRYFGRTRGVSVFETVNDTWRSFVEDGTVTREEYSRMNHVQYYRSEEEWRAPFDDPHGPVSRSGLRLLSLETSVLRCPLAAGFEVHRDPERLAADYIPAVRYWSESIYAGALSGERPHEERREILERFYAAYRERVRRHPGDHAMDHVNAYMVIAKE